MVFENCFNKNSKEGHYFKKSNASKYKTIEYSRFVMKRIHLMLLWSFMRVMIVPPMLSLQLVNEYNDEMAICFGLFVRLEAKIQPNSEENIQINVK